MKVFKWVISIVLWTVITLNVLFFSVTRLPVSQRFIGEKVAEAVGDLLGTQVSIGRVDIGLLNRLIIDNLVIHDQNQQEMIRAARVSVKMDILPLMEGKVVISSAQLFGARFVLYRPDALSDPNYQFVIDSLASKDTTKQTPLDVRINSLIIRHSSVGYNQLDIPQDNGCFNTAHLKLNDISAHINLRVLTEDSLNVNFKRLSFNEQSGLSVNRLCFRMEAGRHHAVLKDFQLQMPSTELKIDTVLASYTLNEKSLVPGTLSFASSIRESHITPSDLRCFIPILKNFQRPLFLTASFNGTDLRLNVPHFKLSTSEDDIDILIDGWLEDYRQPSAWHLQMHRIQLSDSSIDFLSKVIPNLPSEINRLDGVQMLGTFDKDHSGLISLKNTILSGIGNIDLEGTIDHQQQFECQLQTEALDLRQLLDNTNLGNLEASLSLRGQLHDHKHPNISADGVINNIDYRGYSYQNIHFNGSFSNNKLFSAVNIDDPNVRFDLTGQISNLLSEEHQPVRDIMIDGSINHLSPTALNLTEELDEAVISADIHADFTASNLNDAVGNLRISKGSVSSTTSRHSPYHLDNFIVTSGYENNIHFVSLKSDFADATIRGEFDYATLPESIIGLVGYRLPTLPGLPVVSHETNNNFSLRLMLSKTDWLRRFLGIDLVLHQPLMLNARVNDHTRELYLEGDLPAFSYNGASYKDGVVHITTPGDTLRCDIGINKMQEDGYAMNAIANIRAAHNELNTSLNWDNHNPDQQISGQMNGIIRLYHNLENEPEAHMRVMPSHIVLNEGVWEIEPSDLIYKKNRLLVDNFMVHRGQQHILIDGIASNDRHDSLSVDLNEMEVAYILNLVDFHSVEFSGRATGHAIGRGLFDKFAAHAKLRVDDFKFEDGRMGTLHADVNWNEAEEQIDIRAVAKDGPGVNTYIDGFISPVHNTIDLGIHADSTYIEFMHSFTSSFLSQITGHTDGNLRLAGTLDNINLTGQLVVDGNLTVEALNTTYYLQRDTVVFIPDDIRLNRVLIHDRDGHEAWLSGGIHHKHLTSLTFDLETETDNLLAYDFPDFGESNFYGTVYASGLVTIKGRPGEVSIDCNVTPLKNSFFVYNAANPDAISRQEFIHWEDSSRKDERGTRKENTTAEEVAAKNSLQGNLAPRSSFLPSRDRTDIYLNFLINATPDATLKLLMDANTNDYITLNGDATIRATYHNKGAFNMFGTFTVDHGTYGVTIQNIIKKNFIFNRGGTIIFAGDPYQAALNLQAVHTVSGVSLSDLNIGNSFSSNTIRVNCLMNIGGITAAPQVDFDLEMPTVNADEQQMIRSIINGQQEMNQQVIYLLGIGRFYTQGVNNAGNTAQSGQTSLAMQSLFSGALSAQINNILNQFLKNDNWNFGANITTGNEGWHNAEYEGIINGRMLNNRLLINGQFGYRDNAKQATPSFIGDFDVQYLLYPNGNLALKVYNQTNDRYFTKSSLNTQGLGIIMKKDFNGLRDLFTSKKRKKKSTKQDK